MLLAEPAVAAVAIAQAPKCSSKGWWIALLWEEVPTAVTFGPILWWWWWWWDKWHVGSVLEDDGLIEEFCAAVIAATAAAGDNKGWCNGLVCEWCDAEVTFLIKFVFVTALFMTAACCVNWCNKFGKLPVGYGRPKLG